MHLVRGSIAAALLLAAIPSAAQQIQLDTIVTSLNSPLFVGHAGDGSNRLFIVEQGGIIKVLQPGGSTPTVFLDITSRVLSGGERGLLGLAFHPQYSMNRRFFVFYTQPDGALAIAEYEASQTNPDTALTTERRILTIPHASFANHNGGMIAFGVDGYLYIGVGDGGGANDPGNNAQNKETLLGKILRIDITPPGSMPPYVSPIGNPFLGATAGRDEIWAYGMRNPWRFSFDRDTHQMWVGDVGQGAREEVDTPIDPDNNNYGWPICEGALLRGTTQPCTDPQYILPLFDYEHVNGRCSLTGGYVYRGTQGTLPDGTYIYGDYCSGEIFGWDGAEHPPLLSTGMSISSFGEDQAGELYVVDLSGSVSRIVGSGPPPPPPCTYSINPTRTTFVAAGGPGQVTVTAGANCPWTAVSNVPWITVNPGSGSGSGNGTVGYNVAVYTGKPKRRNGTITIAGQTFTVQQSK